FHVLRVVKRDHDADITEILHDSSVVPAETDGFHAVFLGYHISFEQVLGPEPRFVFAGAAMRAEAHQRIAGLYEIEQLFGIKVVESIVVHERGDKRRIVSQSHDFESFFAWKGGAFAEIIHQVRGGGSRAAVAHQIHPLSVFPGLEHGLDNLVDFIAVYRVDDGFHFG
ncbi:MAG: hypothetical protein UW91_C0010G0021, partial [Parcubacteria group bacterium GW2011_GWF2_45_11]